MHRGPKRAALFAAFALVTFVLYTPGSASAATVASISAGFDHTCALTRAGGVRCWGDNEHGQLGDGTATASATPVAVIGLPPDIVALSTGVDVSCALTAGGAVWCWGTNSRGQLGAGAGARSTVPLPVVGLSSGVRSISVGYDHTCAAMEDGTARCWGSNSRGSLGDGSRAGSATPVEVQGLGDVTAVSSGAVHACALTVAGGVACWGYNAYGQVGNGTAGSSLEHDVLVATDVVGLSSGVSAIVAGGYHSCAMLAAGGVTCWGLNSDGQLGDGTTTNRSVPGAVDGSAAISTLVLGAYHSCGATSDGSVLCWGYNDVGALGLGDQIDRTVPTPVPGASGGTRALAGGRGHTCRIDASDRATCWGWNLRGQVGDGTAGGPVTTPRPVRYFSISMGSNCSGLQCRFSRVASDPDGEIVRDEWALGDGRSASGPTVDHAYPAAGSYTVTLTSSDAYGASQTVRVPFTVAPWNLKASSTKAKNVITVNLTWAKAASLAASVDVFRNGAFITRTPNTGSFSHTTTSGQATYRVCPPDDPRCSNDATVKG